MAVYDITGIQDYIFSSNKMKENIGASFIVQQALEKYLPDSIRAEDPNALVDWKNTKKFEMPDNESLNIEVVYIGGGNAMVAFKNKDLFIDVNKKFSKILLEKTAGMLRFAVGWTETNFEDFNKDRKEIFKKLDDFKSGMQVSSPLRGISITREGITDGLPAQCKAKEDNEYLSRNAYLKRENYEPSNEYFKKLFEPEIPKEYSFPKDFDDLIKKDESSFMAVIHIDGNNMGDTIENLTEKTSNYNDAVVKIRKLSVEITNAYKKAMRSTASQVVEGLKERNIFEQISDKKHDLPLRPVVLNGDDVTFVCNAKIGIPCVENFLKTINKETITIGNEQFPLSACAGIAFVKSHFPFYIAYQLSESLCREAKIKGKIIAANSKMPMGCWFDYHIVMSGITAGSLSDTRSFHYTSPGKDKPNPLKKNIPGGIGLKYKQYNLIWRPWCISGGIGSEYEKFKWEHGLKILEEFRKWPRSKAKSLRNEFLKGKENVNTLVSEFESRACKLPEMPDLENKLFINRQTPYVDILEIMDLYIKLPEAGGVKI